MLSSFTLPISDGIQHRHGFQISDTPAHHHDSPVPPRTISISDPGAQWRVHLCAFHPPPAVALRMRPAPTPSRGLCQEQRVASSQRSVRGHKRRQRITPWPRRLRRLGGVLVQDDWAASWSFRQTEARRFPPARGGRAGGNPSCRAGGNLRQREARSRRGQGARAERPARAVGAACLGTRRAWILPGACTRAALFCGRQLPRGLAGVPRRRARPISTRRRRPPPPLRPLLLEAGGFLPARSLVVGRTCEKLQGDCDCD